MKMILPLVAVAEAATGVALLVTPTLVLRALFGADLSSVAGRDDLAAAGIVIGRVAGIALIGLGIACWPGAGALRGMLVYSALATIYLVIVGFGGKWVGPLLWPAVVVHAALTFLLYRSGRKPKMPV